MISRAFTSLYNSAMNTISGQSTLERYIDEQLRQQQQLARRLSNKRAPVAALCRGTETYLSSDWRHLPSDLVLFILDFNYVAIEVGKPVEQQLRELFGRI
jgi:hypothetical protein